MVDIPYLIMIYELSLSHGIADYFWNTGGL
jgi:hypothetical protein